jgi:hypothetical protein
MSTTFNIHTTGEGESSSVTFVSNGALVTVGADHPNFKRVVHALAEGNDPIEFVDILKAVDQVSDRVTVLDHAVLFDGEEIANGVARTILRYKSEGRDTANLVRFLERVQQNPSRHSREGLWRWVQDRDLFIDDEGRIVAWKSVQVHQDWEVDDEGYSVFDEDGQRIPLGEPYFTSHSEGTAWVNGHKFVGKIPYGVGDEVTMPREDVEDDPGVACHHGLHVGAFSYASTFGRSDSKILEVAVAPEDVVSVPNDSNGEKIRCCRFVVLGLQDRPEPVLSHWEPEGDEWDEEEAEEAALALTEDEVARTFLGRLFDKFKKGEV